MIVTPRAATEFNLSNLNLLVHYGTARGATVASRRLRQRYYHHRCQALIKIRCFLLCRGKTP